MKGVEEADPKTHTSHPSLLSLPPAVAAPANGSLSVQCVTGDTHNFNFTDEGTGARGEVKGLCKVTPQVNGRAQVRNL